MTTVLEKVKRLEKYVAADENAVDQLVEQTLDKLFERETSRLENAKYVLKLGSRSLRKRTKCRHKNSIHALSKANSATRWIL